ncbi:MAG TPA: peptide deformylase [Syntrophales bacterium]|nr:peptide deformylase [Syntrophales bacterium]HPQ43262.1 peptide deformylase [Syntrophales bacterium]
MKTWKLWENEKINQEETRLLRRSADAIPIPFTEEAKKDIETLIDAFVGRDDAAGLAAPQIGISKRIVVFRNGDFNDRGPLQKNDGSYDVLVNPRITQIRGDKEKSREACLSCPDISVDVVRATSIKVKAYNEEGEKINKRYTGFLARVVQHELDHLDGKLIVDRGTTIYYPKEKALFFDKIFQGE